MYKNHCNYRLIQQTPATKEKHIILQTWDVEILLHVFAYYRAKWGEVENEDLWIERRNNRKWLKFKYQPK